MIGGVVAVAAVAATWLVRWPLLEGTVRSQIRTRAAELLHADVTVGRLNGSLIFGFTAREVALRAPRWEATVDSIALGYGPFGVSKPDIEILGARLTLVAAPKESGAPALPSLESLAEAGKLRFRGRLRVRDSIVIVAEGKEVVVEDAEIRGGDATLRARVVLDKPRMASKLTAVVRRQGDDTSIDVSWDRYLQVHGVLGRRSDLRVDATLGELRELLPIRVDGDASLHLRVTGSEPVISGALETHELAIAGTEPLTMSVPMEARGGAVVLPRAMHSAPYGEIALQGRVPLSATEGMDVSITAARGGIRTLLPEVLRPWGPPSLEVTVVARGTVAAPEVRVHAESGGIPYRLPSPFGEISGFRLDATMTGGEVRVERCDGTLGGGPFHVEGSWRLDRKAVEARLTGADLLAVDMDNVRVRLDPDVRLTGNVADGFALKGEVRVPLALIYEEGAIPKPRGGKLAAPGLRLPLAAEGGAIVPGVRELDGLKLDLNVQSTGEVRVENSVVGTIVHGALRVQGTAAAPAVSGTVETNQGEIRLASGVFVRIVKGRVEIYAEPGRDPSMHFEGQSGEGEGAIRIVVSGLLPQPGLTLQSDPPRPQSDLLSMLAFGRVAGSVGEGQALGALVQQLYQQVTDEWPSAEPKTGLLSRLSVSTQTGRPAATLWDLPARSTASGTAVRTEYILNRYLSIVAESNLESNWSGDLRFRIRFP